jgi:hypothetical protein
VFAKSHNYEHLLRERSIAESEIGDKSRSVDHCKPNTASLVDAAYKLICFASTAAHLNPLELPTQTPTVDACFPNAGRLSH